MRWAIRRVPELMRKDQTFGSLTRVQFVEFHARIGGVELEVEGSGLDRLLLLAGQLGAGPLRAAVRG